MGGPSSPNLAVAFTVPSHASCTRLSRSASIRLGLFLLSVLSISSGPVLAQARPDTMLLNPGARLRVTEDSVRPTRFIGILLAQKVDSRRLQTAGWSPFRPVVRSRVVRLEVGQGQQSHLRLGATLGILFGTAVGFLSVQGKTYELGDNTATSRVLASIAVGGLPGTLSTCEASSGCMPPTRPLITLVHGVRWW
jgi:hypothetical protein